MKPYYILLLSIFSATAALAQAPTEGTLLVATPEMRDPRFSETVILLLRYESDSVFGVAINRPTWVEPSTAFPNMEFLQRYRGNLYFGGPMDRSNVLVLIRDPENQVLDTKPIFHDIYLSTDPEFLRDIIGTESTDQNLRLYAGHASWDAGQLDREIAAGHWRVIPAHADLVFAQDPLKVWQQVLALGSEISVKLSFREPTIAATIP